MNKLSVFLIIFLLLSSINVYADKPLTQVIIEGGSNIVSSFFDAIARNLGFLTDFVTGETIREEPLLEDIAGSEKIFSCEDRGMFTGINALNEF